MDYYYQGQSTCGYQGQPTCSYQMEPNYCYTMNYPQTSNQGFHLIIVLFILLVIIGISFYR